MATQLSQINIGNRSQTEAPDKIQLSCVYTFNLYKERLIIFPVKYNIDM